MPITASCEQIGQRCSSPYQMRIQRRVLQPEVGGQVDDGPDPLAQVGYQVLRGAVGQGQEHQVETLGRAGVDLGQVQVGVGGGQARIEVGYPAAGLGVGGGQCDARMAGWPGARRKARRRRIRMRRRHLRPGNQSWRNTIQESAYSCGSSLVLEVPVDKSVKSQG